MQSPSSYIKQLTCSFLILHTNILSYRWSSFSWEINSMAYRNWEYVQNPTGPEIAWIHHNSGTETHRISVIGRKRIRSGIKVVENSLWFYSFRIRVRYTKAVCTVQLTPSTTHTINNTDLHLLSTLKEHNGSKLQIVNMPLVGNWSCCVNLVFILYVITHICR